MYTFETQTATHKAIVTNGGLLMVLYVAYKQQIRTAILVAAGAFLFVAANALIVYFARKANAK